MHGYNASHSSSSSRWCPVISTKSGSIAILLLPILCSLPLAVCSTLHANISYSFSGHKTRYTPHYNHQLLIAVLISFCIMPIVFSFALHAKVIHFIHCRPSPDYLTQATHVLPSKRHELVDSHPQRRPQPQLTPLQNQLVLPPLTLSCQRFVYLNRRTLAASTSSQSGASSNKLTSKSITPPAVLGKINCQANANGNRSVLLMILLLSVYVSY